MPKFAANLSFLFKEGPFIERFSAAMAAGFDAVEVLFPYDEPAKDIIEVLRITGLPLALINTPPPNYTGGPRGFAATIGGQERFEHDFRRALRFADALGARHLHIMAGVAEGDEAHRTFVQNLTWATGFAEARSPERRLTIEPINTVDMPGYFLNDFDQAAQILDEVGAPNLGLQFDTYHAHKITGDMPATWAKHGHRALHIQIADPDGRHEPVAGAIDYPAFFAQLDAEGYAGYVSAEYYPRKSTEAGLKWLKEAKAAMRA